MKGLTQRQTQILDFIDHYVAEHAFSPSYHDIMREFNFTSPGTVYRHLQALKRKGAVVSEHHCSRSILPTKRLSAVAEAPPPLSPAPTTEIPIIARLRAGFPLETHASIRTVALPPSLAENGDGVYGLDVVGNGLHDELIADGDIVLVATTSQPQDGDTVVTVVREQETILRRYFIVEDYLRLESRNLSQQPIIVCESDARHYGVVIGVIRQYKTAE